MQAHKRFLSCFFPFLLFLGCVGWFGGFAMAVIPPLQRLVSPRTELPLGDLMDIAVDGRGRVYCAAGAYQRIQVYDPTRRFIRGWFVWGFSGYGAVWIGPDGLHVAVPKQNKHYLYDANGQVLQTWNDGDRACDLHAAQGRRRLTDAQGTVYEIARYSVIFPRVVKTVGSGPAETAVSTPLYLWILQAPLPAWIFFAIGIVGLNVLHGGWFQRRSEAQQPAGRAPV